MRRSSTIGLACLAAAAGCAVVRTTDVTDATYKRHQSVAVLGWPVYSRVTDRQEGIETHLAVKAEGANQTEDVMAAEMVTQPIEPALPLVGPQ